MAQDQGGDGANFLDPQIVVAHIYAKTNNSIVSNITAFKSMWCHPERKCSFTQ